MHRTSQIARRGSQCGGHVREGVKSRLTNRQICRLLPAWWLPGEHRKNEKFCWKDMWGKKVNYSCSSIRSSNVTSFFLSFFLLHVVFNVYLSKIIKLWYVRGVA